MSGPLFTPSSTPLRSKRNFKALALPDLEGAVNATPAREDPIATRPAPPPGKKRPPPLGDNPVAPAFALDPLIAESPATSRTGGLQSTLAKLDLKAKNSGTEGPIKDLKDADFEKLADLGHGNGGSVIKVHHTPTGTIMAKKIIFIEAKTSVRKQIQRELSIMHECHSPYIISCFGSYLAEPNICICIEFMDKGSFDGIYKSIGAIDINVVCLVAMSVLEGLTYLYDVHRIIHRDIKPSNILCNSEGSIKLCDFGVSGELINSLAKTFVGTSIYMSPERIQGAEYSVKSDIWSLGISLVELATGRFPFCEVMDDDNLSDLEEEGGTHHPNRTPTNRDSFALSSAKPRGGRRESKIGNKRLSRRIPNAQAEVELMPMSIIELMHQIVREPAPSLDDKYPEEAQEFVDACLMKDPNERHTPKTLLEYRWMDDARDSGFDAKAWATSF